MAVLTVGCVLSTGDQPDRTGARLCAVHACSVTHVAAMVKAALNLVEVRGAGWRHHERLRADIHRAKAKRRRASEGS